MKQIILIVLIIILLIMSLLFFIGKGGFLIAGYNTAPKEEKEKYDDKKLNKAMGIMTTTLAAFMGLMLLVNSELYEMIIGILTTVALIPGLIYMNTKCMK